MIWNKYNSNNKDFYEIDNTFLTDHGKEILKSKIYFDNQNKKMKKLKNCIHISYEEFFYSDIGIKKIEEYLDIKTKTLPNSSNKLRNGSLSLNDKLKNEISLFSDELKNELKILLVTSKNDLKNELIELSDILKSELRDVLNDKKKLI